MEEFIAKHREEIASTEWFRLAGLSRDAAVDQLSGRDDGLPVGQPGAADGIWQACAAGERAIEASASSKGRGSEATDEVPGLGRRAPGRGSAGDRGTGKDRGRVGMCAGLCRALSDVRGLSQPGDAEAGVGSAHPEVPVFLSLRDASGVWIFKCADTNVVSLCDPGVYERTGVAGAADGTSGDEVRAAG
jgi:hypothetical protein